MSDTPTAPRQEPRFLLQADVAAELNISLAQVYALIRSGDLKAIQIGGRNQWRIERRMLEEHIAEAYRRTAANLAGKWAARWTCLRGRGLLMPSDSLTRCGHCLPTTIKRSVITTTCTGLGNIVAAHYFLLTAKLLHCRSDFSTGVVNPSARACLPAPPDRNLPHLNLATSSK